MIKDEEKSLDIVQEVFVAIWTGKERLEIKGCIRSYLYTAVRNRVISVIRKEKIHEKYLCSLSELIGSDHIMADENIRYKELKFQIEREIDRLPPLKMKAVFNSVGIRICHTVKLLPN